MVRMLTTILRLAVSTGARMAVVFRGDMTANTNAASPLRITVG